ncbi:MAG: DNA-3-methyladenine glycosylase, partial [Candidatus Niyogibacteria bacterium]|nr:DNA-3-methyladenine glycosylase [Candidatus Niyogibacteria bacterium]
MRSKSLPRIFFEAPTLQVARDLLGKTLVRRMNGKIIRSLITETEAYIGERDKACHASRGRTARTAVMYEKAGTAYVYLIYGMHWCLNIVTERENFPAAVLIRGIEIDGKRISGPGRVCKALGIDKKFNGADLVGNRALWLEESSVRHRVSNIQRGPRVGVDYADAWAKKPWRFWIAEPRTP